jgi:hypothetical protein
MAMAMVYMDLSCWTASLNKFQPRTPGSLCDRVSLYSDRVVVFT